MPPITLKSTSFRQEREATWRELEDLVARAERGGPRVLSAEELMRLPVLYRATLSSLSVARGISLDRNVVDYLEALAGRAYLIVHGPRTRFLAAVRDFLAVGFPVAVRACRYHVAIAAAVLLLGIVVGWVATAQNEDRFYAFVGAELSKGRDPAASRQELERVLFSGAEADADALHAFATFLFTHNARIGILAFALGFALGLPTLILIVTNGLMLGAFAALHANRDLSLEFWSWILPHGVTELLAVILCGAAGLVLAEAVIFPGRQTRLRNLARRGRVAGRIVLGAVLLFFIAGLIEGIFRQTVQDITLRYALATATALLWGLYFVFGGRGGAPRDDEEVRR